MMLKLEKIKDIARNHVPKPVGDWHYYSVLLPLVEKGGELHVLYELRSSSLEVQPGEVSFPGGGIEKGETPYRTAIRETVEELGIHEGAIEIVSELDYLISYGNRKLHCFLGVIEACALDKAEINISEVETFFLVPLAWLMENDPDIYDNRIIQEPAAGLPLEKLGAARAYRWRPRTSAIPVYLWQDPLTSQEFAIWGMTAQLTMAFVELLRNEEGRISMSPTTM